MPKTPLLLHGHKRAFEGRITEGRLFRSYSWPNQWSHRVPIGTKWKIRTLSFYGYPLIYCRSSGIDSTAPKSQAFFQNAQNVGNWPFSISPENQFLGPFFHRQSFKKKLIDIYNHIRDGLLWTGKSLDFADIGLQVKTKESMAVLPSIVILPDVRHQTVECFLDPHS